MKIKIELEMGYLDDERLEKAVVEHISEKLLAQFEHDARAEFGRRAQAILKAKTEELIYGVLEKPVSVSTGWNDTKEYPSLYEMIETQMTELYQGKLGAQGQCKEDPLLGRIKETVKREVSTMLHSIEQSIKNQASRAAKTEVERSKLIQAIQDAMK